MTALLRTDDLGSSPEKLFQWLDGTIRAGLDDTGRETSSSVNEKDLGGQQKLAVAEVVRSGC